MWEGSAGDAEQLRVWIMGGAELPVQYVRPGNRIRLRLIVPPAEKNFENQCILRDLSRSVRWFRAPVTQSTNVSDIMSVMACVSMNLKTSPGQLRNLKIVMKRSIAHYLSGRQVRLN